MYLYVKQLCLQEPSKNLADINCCQIAINCSLWHLMSFSNIWKKYVTVFGLNVKGPEDFILLEENFERERERERE